LLWWGKGCWWCGRHWRKCWESSGGGAQLERCLGNVDLPAENLQGNKGAGWGLIRSESLGVVLKAFLSELK